MTVQTSCTKSNARVDDQCVLWRDVMFSQNRRARPYISGSVNKRDTFLIIISSYASDCHSSYLARHSPLCARKCSTRHEQEKNIIVTRLFAFFFVRHSFARRCIEFLRNVNLTCCFIATRVKAFPRHLHLLREHKELFFCQRGVKCNKCQNMKLKFLFRRLQRLITGSVMKQK